ncbi:MAG: potassium channel protein [Chitinophagaceae bacterium]|nr:potassium channel protein [Chitinophagaceae bacterium]
MPYSKKETVRIFLPLIIIICIVIIGVLGYMIIEHYRFLDALYMTVISITTAGYSEIRPLSDAGRVFTILLLISSFSTFAFALATITRYIVSGEMGIYFKMKKIMKSIDQLDDHVVLCGFGRNAQQAATILQNQNVPFVVIENQKEMLDSWMQHHSKLLFVKGDATNDDVLMEAGITRARAILSTLPDDADNVYIVLSAKSLNPHLKVISRASTQSSAAKLKKAGADNVIMPYKIGGTHMANLVSKPDVIEFIDFLSGEEGGSINIESVDYETLPDSIKDRTLREIMDWKKTGVNCIGIKDEQGRYVINPPDDVIISRGMKVMVLGTMNQIHAMKDNVDH